MKGRNLCSKGAETGSEMFALGLRNRVFWIVWWLKRWLNAGFWCLETGVWCGDMARVMWKRAVGGRGAAELGCNIRNMRLLMGGIGGGMRGLEFGVRVSELGSEGLVWFSGGFHLQKWWLLSAMRRFRCWFSLFFLVGSQEFICGCWGLGLGIGVRGLGMGVFEWCLFVFGWGKEKDALLRPQI